MASLRGPSRTFLCVLAGLLMTVAGRLGPWSWPLWPANSLLDLYLARVQPSVVSGEMKVLGLFVLLFVNVAFWAAIAGVAWWALDRCLNSCGRTHRRGRNCPCGADHP